MIRQQVQRALARSHSGCYCLSHEQLQRWIVSGQNWRGRLSYFGPRESAATGCLGEVFRLYEPHPANMAFLEVRHWGSEYAEAFAATHASAVR